MSGESAYEFFYLNSLSGGLNVVDSPLAIAEDEMQIADNITITEQGAIKRRPGYISAGGTPPSDSSTIYNFYRYYRTGKISQTIMSTDNVSGAVGQIYNYTTAAYITGGTPLANKKARFKVYKDTLFIYNGQSFNVTTDGITRRLIGYDTSTGYTDLGTDIRCMEICDDRIFIVKESEPNTLYFSEYGGWNTGADTDLLFRTSDYLNIPRRSDDSTGITAIVNYGNNDELLVFRENDTYVLLGVGATDYSLRLFRGEAGCISQDAIVELEDGRMVVVGNDKIYLISGDQMVPISHQIESKLSANRLENAVAAYSPQNRIVIISANDRSFVLNITQMEYNVDPLLAWSEWTTLAPQSMCRFKAVSDNNKVYLTIDGDNELYVLGGSSDDGADIKLSYQSKTFDLEQFAEKKQFRSIRTLQDTTQLEPFSVKLIVDDKVIQTRTMVLPSTGTIWGSFVWGEANWTGANRLNGSIIIGKNATGFEFSIRIDSEDSVPLTIHRIAVEMLGRNRDRLYGKE